MAGGLGCSGHADSLARSLRVVVSRFLPYNTSRLRTLEREFTNSPCECNDESQSKTGRTRPLTGPMCLWRPHSSILAWSMVPTQDSRKLSNSAPLIVRTMAKARTSALGKASATRVAAAKVADSLGHDIIDQDSPPCRRRRNPDRQGVISRTEGSRRFAPNGNRRVTSGVQRRKAKCDRCVSRTRVPQQWRQTTRREAE